MSPLVPLLAGLLLAAPSVAVRGPAEPVRVTAGREATVRLVVEIAKGYHVYAENPADYIPLTFEAKAPFEVRRVKLPKPHLVKFPYEEREIPVFEGTVEADVVLGLRAGAPAPEGRAAAEIQVGYQACTDRFCEDPKKVLLPVPVEILPGTGTGTIPVPREREPERERERPPSPALGGSLFQILGAFLAGFLVTLTPCVYPVIPVTISYFQQQAPTRAKAIPLALTYGLGIIVMYAVLGVVMARLGRDLGSLLGNVYVGWGFVALFIFLALSMFGFYDLSLPSSWQTKLQSGEHGGVAGALFLGLILSLVAAPCVGPVAGGLMLIVSQTGDILFGVLAFGSFGFGLAFPFMVLGIFSGALAAAPRAGEWMESVKHLFGYVLVAFAIYFAFVASGSAALTYALAGGWFLASGAAAQRSENVLARALAIALLACGLYFLFGPYVLKLDGPIVAPEKLFASQVEWRKDHDAALEEARTGGKPAMIDFTARWCNACHELDLVTFRDARVVAELRRYVPVKVDVTRDEKNQRIKNEKYKAYAIPFIAFYDSRGEYVAKLPREGSQGITTEDVLTTLKEIR